MDENDHPVAVAFVVVLSILGSAVIVLLALL
jgi:hypothetical protein